MTPQQRPYVTTPTTVPELAEALRVAWQALFGADPTRASLLVLLAQWHLETAGGAKCVAWNLGNAKSVPGDGYDWTEFATTEVVNGAVVHMTCRFRAFASLEGGAADYLRLLSRRFARAWPAVLAGDVVGFAGDLHALGYYTAPVRDYAQGMLARRAAVEGAWPEVASDVTDGGANAPLFVGPDPETNT